jgi:molybdopterin molybdotransferase
MTGAVMPDGTDTVILQEHVKRADNRILVSTDHRAGQNVRRAGEDIAVGQIVLHAGRRLMPADLGVAASLGIAEITVRRRPRIAFFSTGDELRSIGEPLNKGQIYDSNRYTLYGMLSRLGVEIIDMGVVPDVRERIQFAFREASAIAETLNALGEVNFWKVAMKPGRPLAFGTLGDAVFFGLPGNPVSVMVTFYQFVKPAVRRMMGDSDLLPLTVRARCITRLRKRPGRVEFQRGVLATDANGALTVTSTGQQGSGILRSMIEANCFIVLPMGSDRIEPGTMVDVQPFHGLI